MKNPWRFFFVVEALLASVAIWQMAQNEGLLIFLIIGILCLYFSLRKSERTRFTHFQLVLGCILIFISLINSPAAWIMVIFAILFIGLKGVEITGVNFSEANLWNKKKMVIVETETPKEHNEQKQKNRWFGNERIGTQVYEWDDINIDLISGDTIIDLGNTILPKDDNIVIVRKGFGRTRILVPYGIGLVVEHAALYGSISFDGEIHALHNESIKLYSEDYDQTSRRLKILTNTFVGDTEVIRV